MLRSEVFEALNAERQHQAKRWPVSFRYNPWVSQEMPGAPLVNERAHEVSSWLSFIEVYLNRAKVAFACGGDHWEGLGNVRKAIALGVALLEQHGCPTRQDKNVQEKERDDKLQSSIDDSMRTLESIEKRRQEEELLSRGREIERSLGESAQPSLGVFEKMSTVDEFKKIVEQLGPNVGAYIEWLKTK